MCIYILLYIYVGYLWDMQLLGLSKNGHTPKLLQFEWGPDC